MKKTLMIYTVFAISAFSYVRAQESELPGNPELPSSEEELTELAKLEQGWFAYDVKEYFQRPKQSSFRF